MQITRNYSRVLDKRDSILVIFASQLAPIGLSPESVNRCHIHTSTCVALAGTVYSASAVESATPTCLFSCTKVDHFAHSMSYQSGPNWQVQ